MTWLILLTTSLLGAVTPACSEPDEIALSADAAALTAARTAWRDTKVSCSTYHYTDSFTSFTGRAQKTQIEITADQPTRRVFVGTDRTFSGGTLTTSVFASWAEGPADMNSHPEGSRARTMEQLFDECERNVLSKDPAQNTTIFEADSRGVLKACVYTQKNCADDCTTGISLSDFGCGQLELAQN